MANVLLRKPKSYVKWSKGRIGNDFFRSVSTHYTFALVTWIDTCIRLHNDNRFFLRRGFIEMCGVLLSGNCDQIEKSVITNVKTTHISLFIQSENYEWFREQPPTVLIQSKLKIMSAGTLRRHLCLQHVFAELKSNSLNHQNM